MNVKKKALKALSPDFVFRNSEGRELVVNSKTTLGMLALFGGSVQITEEGKSELPPGPLVFDYVGIDGHK